MLAPQGRQRRAGRVTPIKAGRQRRDGPTEALRTISASLRLTEKSLQRLLELTGKSTAFHLSSTDGQTTVRLHLEVASVPASHLVIGRRKVVLDWAQATIARNGDRITLSRLELRLLAALVDCAPEPATRRRLIARLWPPPQRERFDGELALAVAVCALRKRFSAIRIPNAIRTIRSKGYCLSV